MGTPKPQRLINAFHLHRLLVYSKQGGDFVYIIAQLGRRGDLQSS